MNRIFRSICIEDKQIARIQKREKKALEKNISKMSIRQVFILKLTKGFHFQK